MDTTDSDIWVHEPAKLDEFVTDHLRLPALSDRQYQDILTFLGTDPKKIIPRDTKDMGSLYNLMCLLWGKGSGKDYIASIIATYLLHIFLCMRNPQEYLGFPQGEAIDIVIVSYSADQALYISFDKIKERIKNWAWLRRHFSVRVGEKYVTATGRPLVNIHQSMIRTHNNVRIISEHSANESYEGYNIFFFIMSEASAFKSATKERNGSKVFNTLKTSASSRFPGRWRGIVMSFPRFDQDTDFTHQLYEQGMSKGEDEETKSKIFSSRGAPWEVKPERFFPSGLKFEFEGQQVPIEYKEEFESDPDDCKRKYLCIAGKTGTNIIPEEVILKAVHEKPPLIEFENVIEKGKIQSLVFGLDNRQLFVDDYLITVDLGEVHSAAALAIQHLDPHYGYVLDAIGAWTPDPDRGHSVDLPNVREVLMEICEALPQCKVGFDQWQSRLMRADLKAKGIETLEYHTYDRDYKGLRQGMALGVARIVKSLPLIIQLKALKEVNGATVLDTKMSARKDLADVVVGGFKTLMEGVKLTNLPGTIIGENLSQFGSVIYK